MKGSGWKIWSEHPGAWSFESGDRSKQKDGYEMLSGHNRQRAAMLAGIDKIPAIVKENLSDEDAIVYVIETNMIQRSFSELLPSEKAAVLAVRYEKISSQGKRNDILQEIAALNGQEGTCGHGVHKSRSRDELETSTA